MNISKETLEYALNPTLHIVEQVYDRYNGLPPAVVPGISHLGDIRGNTAQLLLTAGGDPQQQRLLTAAFSSQPANPGGAVRDGSLFGSVSRDSVNGTLFIAFRGTETATEWIDDFRFAPLPFSEVPSAPLVHAGFHAVYRVVRDSVFAQVKDIKEVSKVIVTGHSLGAAIADLCALDLVTAGVFGKLDVYTFAGPRVYFFTAHTFDTEISTSLRIVNVWDIVPHVPSILQGYVHVSGGFEITGGRVAPHSLAVAYANGLSLAIASATHTVSIGGSESPKETLSPDSHSLVGSLQTSPPQLINQQEVSVALKLGKSKVSVVLTTA